MLNFGKKTDSRLRARSSHDDTKWLKYSGYCPHQVIPLHRAQLRFAIARDITGELVSFCQVSSLQFKRVAFSPLCRHQARLCILVTLTISLKHFVFIAYIAIFIGFMTLQYSLSLWLCIIYWVAYFAILYWVEFNCKVGLDSSSPGI